MSVITVIMIIDLCYKFPTDLFSILGTDTPQNVIGVVKEKKCEGERYVLLVLFTFTLPFNNHLLIRITHVLLNLIFKFG